MQSSQRLTHGCDIQIVYPKTLFAAKGLHTGWDHLANISASVDILDQVQQNIAISLEAPYRRTTHTTPNTSGVVWTVANKARELKLNAFYADREGNDNIKPTVDTLATGELGVEGQFWHVRVLMFGIFLLLENN